MNCQKCGAANDASALYCIRCGTSLQQSPAPPAVPSATPPVLSPPIPNYLVQSILVTLFCCLPFGVPAIVFAAQVNSKVQAGDVRGALDASRKAKMWCWISFGLGLMVVLFYIIAAVIGGIAANSQ